MFILQPDTELHVYVLLLTVCYIFIKNVSRLNELWNERRKIQFLVKMYYMLLSIKLGI